MWITGIDIKNFRNYRTEKISFSSGLNYIYGANGSGKTNLLEAIGLLSHGKSMRLRNLEDLIFDGRDTSFLKGNYQESQGPSLSVSCSLARASGKRITVNGKNVNRISDVFRLAPTVQCFENDTLLLQGPPSARRNFIDCLCAQMFPTYLGFHREFREILAQRNSALKNQTLKGQLKEAVDEVFVKASIPVIQLRQRALMRLSVILERQKHSFEEETDFSVSENSFSDSIEYDDLYNKLKTKLNKPSLEETRFFRTGTGPHKDSFEFVKGSDKIKARASRGQVKNMIFRLKMAEFDLLKDELDRVPIVLLDDVFAEMDQKRRGNLLNLLELGAQVFLASTGSNPADDVRFSNSVRRIEICDGAVLSNDVILHAA